MTDIGFGNRDFTIAIYIANRPPIDDYPQQSDLRPLAAGELQHIVANSSNHWRKVFNVYAKFLHQLGGSDTLTYPSWQDYRNSQLLQPGCSEALLFSRPDLERNNTVHIIAGKTYASELSLPSLQWLDAYFAINPQHKLIVSPYLDYRQLSNQRIDQLVTLVKSMEGVCDG